MFGIIWFSTIFAAFVAGSLSFNLLLKRLRDDHANDWELSGYPQGWFDFTFSEHPIRSMLASHRLFYAWLFSTPDWIRYDRYAWKLLAVFRVSSLVMVVCVFGIPLIALLLS